MRTVATVFMRSYICGSPQDILTYAFNFNFLGEGDYKLARVQTVQLVMSTLITHL